MDDDIEAQLAQLEAQRDALLAAKRARASTSGAATATDAQASTSILVGASPSPAKKKRKVVDANGRRVEAGRKLFTGPAPSTSKTSEQQHRQQQRQPADRLPPQHDQHDSSLIGDMDHIRNRLKQADAKRAFVRSTDFKSGAAKRPTATDNGSASAGAVAATKKGKQRAQPDEQPNEEQYKAIGNERDDNLALVHRLELGPKQFNAFHDDPLWNRVEPNSQIRLKERTLPHDELQEHLSDRYHVSPELLYSLVRPSKGGMDYEVPLEGDWIVIGVLADKSEIRTTGGAGGPGPSAGQIEAERKRAAQREAQERRRKLAQAGGGGAGAMSDADDALLQAGAHSDDEIDLTADPDDFGEDAPDTHALAQAQAQRAKKRYVTFKLLDLGKRNAGGGQGVLHLRLFEADPARTTLKQRAEADDGSGDEFVTSTGVRVRKERKDADGPARNGAHAPVRTDFRGGSGGAYEKFWKERDGTVVAILNPRIMKPWQGPAGNANPNANILSLTPESADSIIVIGRSEDLGSCQAKKRDGKLCGQWCDKRVADACDWHVQQAVKTRRAGRAEFFAGTGGMSTISMYDRDLIRKGIPNMYNVPPSTVDKPPTFGHNRAGTGSAAQAYDPFTRTGLLPRGDGGRQTHDGLRTYVVGMGSRGGPAGRVAGVLSGRGGAPRPQSGAQRFVDAPAGSGDMARDGNSALSSKERAAKRAREEADMRDMLRRDGGKSLGAKYLVKNGKAPVASARTAAPARTSSSQTASGEDDRMAAMDVAEPKRKRVFDVQAVRKIGWDPSLLGESAGSSSRAAKSQQKKLEALQALSGGTSRAAPKLGPLPGKKKIRSGVVVPDALKKRDALETADDWDELDIQEAVKRSNSSLHTDATDSKQDSGGFLFSSDEEDNGEYGGGEHNTRSDDDSDLEIEAPVSIEMD